MTVTSTAHLEQLCQHCGACCAAFRVSFYWAEGEERGLPSTYTEQVNDWYACMAGTWARQPHCAALAGTVGESVCCQVYDARPTPCREVQPGDERCQQARAHHQLPPLVLEPWDG